MNSAKSIGCVTIVKTIDNLNGPVAIGNLKTLIVEGIKGFIDFQVLAAYQPAITKILAGRQDPRCGDCRGQPAWLSRCGRRQLHVRL